jgi:superfamily II DNA/RNA helicase
MFSATFSPEIKKLANTFLTDPVTIEVARANKTADTVTQVVYKIAENQKHALIAHLLRQRELKQVIVFSNTKLGASRLARELEREGMKAVAIHGDRSQQERMAALDAFKKNEIDILVATDVAARGLDISDLPCVINYDLPYNAEDYVHRIGRTGRAGASGDAISLYSDKDERLLADIEKLIKQTIKRAEPEGFNPAPTFADERGERRPRRSEDLGRSPAGRSAERAPRTLGAGGPPRREKVDPWFLKPYEPAKAAAPVQAAPAASSNITKAKPKLAFLLGGAPKQ